MGGLQCSREGMECKWCTLARRLRLLYEISGKSLRQLEQRTSISDSTIHRYITRKMLPDWPTLKRLVTALDGQQLEFRLLWELAKTDQCTPRSCTPEAQQRPASDRLAPAAGHAWIDMLRVVLEDCSDEPIARLAETIINLTVLIDRAPSDQAAASMRDARATCWTEIADRIGMDTPNGRLCAAACRQASQLDRAPETLGRCRPAVAE
jgi:transcriptional regulator with XRE-family HTH domain